MQLKPIIVAVTLGVISNSAYAKNFTIDGEDKGNLDFMFKALTVVDGKSNGFDPNYGTAELLKMKYTSVRWNGVNLSAGFYMDGDLLGNNLDNPSADDKIARGLYTAGDTHANSLMGELNLTGKHGDFGWFVGRTIFKSPLTVSSSSTMPSFHHGYGINYKVNEAIKLSATQITKMAFGARTATEWGLIGEGTGTSGTAINPTSMQAKFIDIEEATLGVGTPETNGITAVNADFNISKASKVSIWNYYADKISNNFYVQGQHKFKIADKRALKVEAQLLNQKEVGTGLAGELDYTLVGAKATYISKGWSAYLAANSSSGDTAMLNAWGGDPAYTSTIFSRNAYRENVTAYKVGGKYKITPKWILSAAYADYGQSDTTVGSLAAASDATEFDISLAWKYSKNLTFKAFHVSRTSEYDTDSNDRTQSHSRIVMVWKY
ncbi:OprD family outer membrane porin [Thiomicrorhabdus sp. 6S2-11]|uniref:OprD family outer membrane porin n=1 Tax=Thiomicrorhabdus marina TaxID=2818442 RepID=A0ABS3Q2C3_9GAMM|nr:OprD family outer membrane porin [Thiomicrorhabdus marina]MBO1926094.1 OprD family outer membrane porin [Thiomicrorhabdus marina]